MLAAAVGGSKNNSPESRIKCDHEVTKPLLPLQGGATAKPHALLSGKPQASQGRRLLLAVPGEGPPTPPQLSEAWGLSPWAGLRQFLQPPSPLGPVATRGRQTSPISTPPDGLPGPRRDALLCPWAQRCPLTLAHLPCPHLPCPPPALSPTYPVLTRPAPHLPSPHPPCPPLTLLHHLEQPLLDELLPTLPASLLLERCTDTNSQVSQGGASRRHREAQEVG